MVLSRIKSITDYLQLANTETEATSRNHAIVTLRIIGACTTGSALIKRPNSGSYTRPQLVSSVRLAKRAYQSTDDAYKTFRKMLAAGHPPDGWDELLAEAVKESEKLQAILSGN
ncbi:MAG TPA: hypothetical protein DIW64_07885 [Cellvibrio sp.]|nr:hypothetical protein [Cellvibrio sp.]